MKAIVHYKYGPPEVLQLVELEKPTPKPNEILVRVMASTVNRTDCARLRAKPFIMRFFTGLLQPEKPVPGTDFAGIVESVGKDVSLYKAGDRVFGFDDGGVNSKAEYMTLSEDKAIGIIPGQKSFEEAAACMEGAHYAYNFINKVKLEKGQRILVNGASGAIGSAMVQLLKYEGAVVTAVCDTRRIDMVNNLGADLVIDYSKVDFSKTGDKYHLIFDASGKSSFGICKPLLEKGGAYISSELGKHSQNPFLALLTPLTGDKTVKFPLPTNIKRSLAWVKKLLEEEHFKPVIDRTYPLEKIAEAYQYVEKGDKTGNVLIVMQGQERLQKPVFN